MVRLTEQLSGAQQMLEEREASARREQSRTDELLDSIRGDYNHSKSSLEERCVCVCVFVPVAVFSMPIACSYPIQVPQSSGRGAEPA